MRTNGSLTLVPVRGLFSSCWLAVFNFDLIVLVLCYYYILFYFVLLLYFIIFYFVMFGCYLLAERSGEKGNYNQDIQYEKRIYFQ